MGDHLRRGLYGIYILIRRDIYEVYIEPFNIYINLYGIYILIRRDIYEVYIEPFNIYINYYREILLLINIREVLYILVYIHISINTNNNK